MFCKICNLHGIILVWHVGVMGRIDCIAFSEQHYYQDHNHHHHHNNRRTSACFRWGHHRPGRRCETNKKSRVSFFCSMLTHISLHYDNFRNIMFCKISYLLGIIIVRHVLILSSVTLISFFSAITNAASASFCLIAGVNGGVLWVLLFLTKVIIV